MTPFQREKMIIARIFLFHISGKKTKNATAAKAVTTAPAPTNTAGTGLGFSGSGFDFLVPGRARALPTRVRNHLVTIH